MCIQYLAHDKTLTKVIIEYRWSEINIQNARNRMILYKIGSEVIEYITKGFNHVEENWKS